MHEAYLARRQRLLEITDECQRLAARKHAGFFASVRRPVLAVTAVALPATLALLKRPT
jgi:hypothetical protein